MAWATYFFLPRYDVIPYIQNRQVTIYKQMQCANVQWLLQLYSPAVLPVSYSLTEICFQETLSNNNESLGVFDIRYTSHTTKYFHRKYHCPVYH